MENENIAAAAVSVQQARTQSQIAVNTLKQSLSNQDNLTDSMVSSVSRVGDVISPGQAVPQSSQILDQYA